MNKLLLASTALVASTTFAMAQDLGVSLSGSAELGVFGADSSGGFVADQLDADLQFHSDLDVGFAMRGETDNGLSFGANVDLDSNAGAFDAAAGGSDNDVFVSGAFGTLTIGDTDGALDWALMEAAYGGSLQDNEEHGGWNGNSGADGDEDGQVARYEYSFGDFAVAASAEIDDAGADDGFVGLGATYSGEFSGLTFGAGIGFQTGEQNGLDRDLIGISMNVATQGGLMAVFNYSDYDGFMVDVNPLAPVAAVMTTGVGPVSITTPAVTNVAMLGIDNHIGLAVGYEVGAILVAANYGKYDFVDGSDRSGYSLLANYDLGGGAVLQAAYGHTDYDAVAAGNDYDLDTYSFGISMSF